MFKNVFGSGFLVRTAHVVLTWVVTLILFLHDTGGLTRTGQVGVRGLDHHVGSVLTELRKQEETGQLLQPVLFVLLVLVSVLLYFAVSLMDPGFILTDESDSQVSRFCAKFCTPWKHLFPLCRERALQPERRVGSALCSQRGALRTFSRSFCSISWQNVSHNHVKVVAFSLIDCSCKKINSKINYK